MSNRIPRHFNNILVEALTTSNGGQRGDRFIITKDEFGHYLGTNMRTEKEYLMFPSAIRNENYFKIIDVA